MPVGTLMPGKTGKHHLVTFLFVFQAQFSIQRDRLVRWQLALLDFGWGLATVAALGGRSFVGRDFHACMGDIGFLAWCMLYWFVIAVLLMERRKSNDGADWTTSGAPR